MLLTACVFAALVAAGLWMLAYHHEPERDSQRRIVLRIDEILPQTQCRECGYPGCLPYAEAIVMHDESIDRCPPGGEFVRRSLAELLGRSTRSRRRAADESAAAVVAVIDETACIGCTKCIVACPVDAIVGARQQMHTVIRDDCTGCKLCIPPCPVDCIDLVTIAAGPGDWRWPRPEYAGPERRTAARS